MISFVVPAHNEESLLGRTLQSIHAAARGLADYEIIVVYDASTDRTPQVADQHGARGGSVQRRQISAVRNAGRSRGLGRRAGVRRRRYDPAAGDPAAALAAFAEGAVGGEARIAFDEAEFRCGPRGPPWPDGGFMRLRRWAAGCFFIFVRREAFATVGGFDEEVFVAEELILSQALKQQGRFVILRERRADQRARGETLRPGRNARAHGESGGGRPQGDPSPRGLGAVVPAPREPLVGWVEQAGTPRVGLQSLDE